MRCTCVGTHALVQMFMLGDSTVRYQFLALAYFLVWRACPRPEHPEHLHGSNFLLDKWSFAKTEQYCDHVTELLTNSSSRTWQAELHLQQDECKKHPEISTATFMYSTPQVWSSLRGNISCAFLCDQRHRLIRQVRCCIM